MKYLGLVVLVGMALMFGNIAYGLTGSWEIPITSEIGELFPGAGTTVAGAMGAAVCIGALVDGLDLTGIDYTGIQVDFDTNVVRIDPSKMPTGMTEDKLKSYLSSGAEFIKNLQAWKAAPNTRVELSNGAPVVKDEDGKYYLLDANGAKGDEVDADNVQTYEFAQVQSELDKLQAKMATLQGLPANATVKKAQAASEVGEVVKLLKNLDAGF